MKNSQLSSLLNEIFRERKIDFSEYREALIERRIATRLRQTGCADYDSYLDYLRGNKDEMDALLSAMTINTSWFFRDEQVFDAIRSKIFPDLLINKNSSKTKIWSCACSRGEEPISVAILTLEYLEKLGLNGDFRIDGTDVDEWAIAAATDGIYTKAELEKMDPKLVGKYFTDMGNNRFWRNKILQKHLNFIEHDIIRDELLPGMDIILCRNLFIYFKRDLQEDCIRKFHKSLNEGGYLILGLTEHIWSADFKEMFCEVDRKTRIYRKI